MATAIALIFPNHAAAEQALDAARSLEKAGHIEFVESGLLVKYQDLSVEMTKEGWQSEFLVGTAAGGVIGALLIGVPVAGAIGGALAGTYAWNWELKSVNAKGLDLRLRLPPGWDAIEVPARARGTEKLSRGTVYANLTVDRKGVAPAVKVNEPVLNAVLATLERLRGKVEAAPPTLDGILALKGVIEVTEEDEREEDRRAAEAAILKGFEQALAELIAMRHAEEFLKYLIAVFGCNADSVVGYLTFNAGIDLS